MVKTKYFKCDLHLKFQQKALKQAKQKKSKSAEFLMVKGGREVTEGVENPAFNTSSPDLSTCQPSEGKVIRHDMPDRTLAAHREKIRLPTSAEPKVDRNDDDDDDDDDDGDNNRNEYSRNYFDPPMDEEINLRQCGMEVSGEGDDRTLYNQLMKLFDDSGRGESQDIKQKRIGYAVDCEKLKFIPCEKGLKTFLSLCSILNDKETLLGQTGKSSKVGAWGSEEPVSSRESQNTLQEADSVIPAYVEDFEKHAQRDVILLASSPFEQVSIKKDFKFEGEGVSQDIPRSSSETNRTLQRRTPRSEFIIDSTVGKKECVTKPDSLTQVTHGSRRAAGSCCKVEQSQWPQPIQIQIECIRGLKNKASPGSYFFRVSLLGQPGSCVLPWWQAGHLKTRTHSVQHDGNFYNVGVYFQEGLSVVLPGRKDVKLGMTFLFELLLHGPHACLSQVVGWAIFPFCDNNLHVVEGKFKCPLLRGPYNYRLDSFRKIEDLICQDLDHWLCNLYFQVIKLPLPVDDQQNPCSHPPFPSEFPVCGAPEAEGAKFAVADMVGHTEKEMESSSCAAVGNISNNVDSCSTAHGLSLSKEHCAIHSKGDSLTVHSVKEKPRVWRSRKLEDYSQDVSYVEELEKHQFSVCHASIADRAGAREFFKHLQFALMTLYAELELAQWQSQSFWYIILLMASLWFLRLYLHYLGQWLFLQAISTPVTKFHFLPYTVELCYPTSLLHVGEELAVVASGPFMLNAILFLLVLIRWGCQLLFAFCPDALSKLIIPMGLWTVLDPLAVFMVDAFLGRLTHNEETPLADAAKLYWVFIRTNQPGILGVIITLLLYVLLFIISSLVLYLYCLRFHNDSWILDAFQRTHSEENKFFIPYDLEISNQELSYIVKRAEQWRGINGERRKVAVCDYLWKDHGAESRVSTCDLQHQNRIPVSASDPGSLTSHIAIYTLYPSGFQELYRHFLRLPDGAFIEVFGDVSAMNIVPREVVTAIEQHLSEIDTVWEESLVTQEKLKGSIEIRSNKSASSKCPVRACSASLNTEMLVTHAHSASHLFRPVKLPANGQGKLDGTLQEREVVIARLKAFRTWNDLKKAQARSRKQMETATMFLWTEGWWGFRVLLMNKLRNLLSHLVDRPWGLHLLLELFQVQPHNEGFQPV
ncbi:uncharacterized protein RHO17_023532 [Thomomys bottae]